MDEKCSVLENKTTFNKLEKNKVIENSQIENTLKLNQDQIFLGMVAMQYRAKIVSFISDKYFFLQKFLYLLK
jgi:hypothetical protein